MSKSSEVCEVAALPLETPLPPVLHMNLKKLHTARHPVRRGTSARALFVRSCTITAALFLLHNAGSVCAQLPDIELPDGITNFSQQGQIGRFLEAQLFPAPVNATVPTMGALIFRLFTWTSGFFKLRLCARADVVKCLQYGETGERSCFYTKVK